MSLNKIIIGFIVILLLFSAIVFLQINKNATPSSQITINNHTFSVELAKTQKDQQQGLSGRNSLPQDQGMLFIFQTPSKQAFWMKGMKFPLDMIFMKDNKVVTIFHNIPVPKDPNATNLPVYTPTQPANYVLEINAGLAQKYQFQEGQTVKIVLK